MKIIISQTELFVERLKYEHKNNILLEYYQARNFIFNKKLQEVNFSYDKKLEFLWDEKNKCYILSFES